MSLQTSESASSVDGYYTWLGSYIKDSAQSLKSQPPPKPELTKSPPKAEVASKAGEVSRNQKGEVSGQGVLLNQQA